MRPFAWITWLLFGAVAAAGHCVAEDKDFPGIENLMPEEDYARAGLNRLTPAEIRALNDWLMGYTAGEAAVVRRTSTEVRDVAKPIRIVARIKPPFTGWSGRTVFYLDNGQVWRQRLPGSYKFTGDNAEVVIRKNAFGYYVMTLTATDRSIGVAPFQQPAQSGP